MPSPVPQQRSREEILDARLDELVDLWLAVTCECGRISKPPFRLLAQRRGRQHLADVLPRLRCEHCKRRPTQAAVVSYPAGPPQYPDTWEVQVFP